MTDMLPAGATIGILGGGQLGRMLSVAASRLGFRTHIFEPMANPPAGHVADRVTTAGYDDLAALRAFAASVDVVTYEFENIPTRWVEAIASDVVEGYMMGNTELQALAHDQPVSARMLERVTEAAFGQRRKMLRQSLKGLPGALEALDGLGIDPQRRAETLSVAEFVSLARALS